MDIQARDVVAIDGEGRDRGVEDHIYGLLLAYSSKPDLTTSIEDWGEGLSTRRCLDFLLYLKHGRTAVCCSFFFNYDVTMWLRDLTPDEKLALWRSGWVVWPQEGERYYYIRYIPNKIFFVGTLARADVDRIRWGEWEREGAYSYYDWPRDQRAILVYDVGSFTQKSFLATLDDWGIPVPDGMREMKAKRGTFTADMADEIERYCEQEMVALAAYVQKLDVTFLAEGIRLPGWYGPGAAASVVMKRYHVREALADPEDAGAYMATMAAYFGGRNELFRMGRLRAVHNYDMNSAYPSAARRIPDLTTGEWVASSYYQLDAPYALWHVTWDVRATPYRSIGPFPFRMNREVLYPSTGEGWYHAVEVSAARLLYGPDAIRVQEGYVYEPGAHGMRAFPFHWVSDMARRRVQLKQAGDPRALVSKYVLNSVYGKLAQHTSEEGRKPPFQCYYAAGLITAITRANLLMFMLSAADGQDVVMAATDGVFCLEPRTWAVGPHLGFFEDAGTLDDCYIIQPGVYYSREGKRRTRGFGVDCLDYDTIAAEWGRYGTEGLIRFSETRFVGIGQCAGTGDFSRYGQWVHSDGRDGAHAQRELSLFPSKKFAHLREGDSLRLLPYECGGMTSQPYEPRRMNDPSWAIGVLDEYFEQLVAYDQPDLTDGD